MSRTSLAEFNCSLARAAEVVGDKWTLLILRDAFYGISSFNEFQSRLGLAKTVLSARLTLLCEHGVLEKQNEALGSARARYRLTPRGRDLFPLVVALVQWGDRWVFGPGNEPIELLDKAQRAPLQPVAVVSRQGRCLHAGDVVYGPGPGADDTTRAAFSAAQSQRVRRVAASA
jgi:DNA-binding HxlR family transcriptional regulator